MKGYESNGKLYIFPQEATAIEGVSTGVSKILVQQEDFEAWKEANSSDVQAIMEKYNYKVITSGPKVWSGHTDDDYPVEEPLKSPDLSWYGMNKGTMEEEIIGTTGISISQEIGPDQAGNIYQDIWVNNPNNLEITLNSTDDNVATFDPMSKTVIFIGAGQADLTASYPGDSEYSAQEISMTVNVTNTEPVEPEETT